MSSEVVLSARDVSKTYRVYSRPHERLLQAWADRRGKGAVHCFEVPAVSGVSFDLERGKGISIIGRNGSGKSTLLEMLTGTLQPTAGTIERHGRVSALLELGAGFNPDFTGRQNYRMAAAIQGLTEREISEIEPEIEAFAEIGPFMDEPVRTYSSGMYVRLAFSAAVHVFPDLLIVDEALAVGDVFFQQKCFDFIERRLGETSKIVVTHDLAAAVRLTSRCLVMDRGEVVFDGEPLEAVEVYTALNLKERSTRVGSVAAARKEPEDEPDEAARQLAATDFDFEAVDPAKVIVVPVDRSTNADALRINRLVVERQRAGTWSHLDPDALVLSPGEGVRVVCEAALEVPVEEPVWGYVIRDRLGNAFFGQNSLGSRIVTEPVKPGVFVVTLEFRWPEVADGDYTLTLGLGNGLHTLHHEIVAWVQGVAKIVCVPHRPVHGMFNNDLQSLTVERSIED